MTFSCADPRNESRLPLLKSLSIYVPRDERFSLSKNEDFLLNSFKALTQLSGPELKSLFDKEFYSFKDVLTLYTEGIKLPDGPLHASLEMINMIFGSGRKFPSPQVIQGIVFYLAFKLCKDVGSYVFCVG